VESIQGGLHPRSGDTYSKRLRYVEGGRVTKRLVDIQDDLLESARSELGTTGIADTVRTALELAATRSARIREFEWPGIRWHGRVG